MSIPKLVYSRKSQNQRVASYEIKGEEQPRIYPSENLLDNGEIDELIWTAYPQIFNKQQILKFSRQTVLESQLRNYQITVRGFIKGLILSKSFRQYNYKQNNNHRNYCCCFSSLGIYSTLRLNQFVLTLKRFF